MFKKYTAKGTSSFMQEFINTSIWFMFSKDFHKYIKTALGIWVFPDLIIFNDIHIFSHIFGYNWEIAVK